MGISERKERERKERKDIILKTAIELFVNEGFEKVTIRKIAEKIEYSPATIYLYFKDKEEILMELHNEGFRILIEYQNKATNEYDNIFLQIKKRAYAYIYFAIKNQHYYYLIFIMSFKQKGLNSPDEWEEGRIAYDLLRQNIKKCIEQNFIKSNGIEETTFAVWSFLHGISLLIALQNGGPVKIDDKKLFIKRTVDFFFENMRQFENVEI